MKIYFLKKITSNNKLSDEILNGRYKKIKEIGRGAQAAVFVVEDQKENNKK